MPTVTRSKSRAVHRSTLEQVESFLRNLPKKEKDHLPIVEAINQVAPSIRAALAKGYSYVEVASLLSEQLGLSVSAWSLRRYVPSGKRGQQGEPPETAPRRQRRKKQTDRVERNGHAPVPEVSPISQQPVVALAQPESMVTVPVDSPEPPLTGQKPVAKTGRGRSQTPEPVEPGVIPKRGRGRTTTTSAKTTRRSSTTRSTGTRRSTPKGK
ncbi:hypothetical protein BST81_11555 [Leptolyngbya sp. 'hensonii']|uniref:hypothetical protein n=1 Tax=Leptolyngbya sp. 'hensonii' TaxID=1922337 RepID=UPI0009501B9D|nr:hypothetical protein [Leptolyngbya sp. 'hensonii']OLP18294.1 hypothetical protein BST81_11555 [Leptolyngbya sp. 'hensonii']